MSACLLTPHHNCTLFQPRYPLPSLTSNTITLVALGGITTITGAVAWIKLSSFAEQWRAWVFLLLNLIMLLILFSPSKNADDKKEAKRVQKVIIEAKCDDSDENLIPGDESRSGTVKKPDSEEGQGYVDEGYDNDDELNERVEAFIVMFRQHLVADAKITKHRQLLAV